MKLAMKEIAADMAEIGLRENQIKLEQAVFFCLYDSCLQNSIEKAKRSGNARATTAIYGINRAGEKGPDGEEGKEVGYYE